MILVQSEPIGVPNDLQNELKIDQLASHCAEVLPRGSRVSFGVDLGAILGGFLESFWYNFLKLCDACVMLLSHRSYGIFLGIF